MPASWRSSVAASRASWPFLDLLDHEPGHRLGERLDLRRWFAVGRREMLKQNAITLALIRDLYRQGVPQRVIAARQKASLNWVDFGVLRRHSGWV